MYAFLPAADSIPAYVVRLDDGQGGLRYHLHLQLPTRTFEHYLGSRVLGWLLKPYRQPDIASSSAATSSNKSGYDYKFDSMQLAQDGLHIATIAAATPVPFLPGNWDAPELGHLVVIIQQYMITTPNMCIASAPISWDTGGLVS